MDTLKSRFKELRALHNVSQEVLAERCGIERVEISNIETGRNHATSARIRQAIAQGFTLSIDDAIAFVEGAITPAEAYARRAAATSERRHRTLGEHPDWPSASEKAREWTGYDREIFDRLAHWSTPHMPPRLSQKFVARLAEALLELDAEGTPQRTGQFAKFSRTKAGT